MHLAPIFALLSVAALADAMMCAPGSVFASVLDPDMRPYVTTKQARYKGADCLDQLPFRSQESASSLCSTDVFCSAYDGNHMRRWLWDRSETLWYQSSAQCRGDHRPDPRSCGCHCAPLRDVCLPLPQVRRYLPSFGPRIYSWYDEDPNRSTRCLNWRRRTTLEQAARDCGTRRLCETYNMSWLQARLLSIVDVYHLPSSKSECLRRFKPDPSLEREES